MNTKNHSEIASFIWSIADLLRGDLKQSQYGRVILPFTLLGRAADQPFYNSSPLSLASLLDTQIGEDLMSYVHSFSAQTRPIFEHFVQQLESSNLLYQVVQEFAAVDLSPKRISNTVVLNTQKQEFKRLHSKRLALG